MVNSIQLTWMLRIYWTCNLTMRFLKYKFYNKLLGGIILFRITLCITWTKFHRRSSIVLRCDRASVNSSSFVLLWLFFFFFGVKCYDPLLHAALHRHSLRRVTLVWMALVGYWWPLEFGTAEVSIALFGNFS